MKKITSVLAVGTIGILAFSQNTHAALVFTPSTSASALANALIGSGITISNESLVGASGQAGTFSTGSSADFPFNQGIALSTGWVSKIPGNSNTMASTPINGPGDTSLTNMIGEPTYDASTLSFDFQFGDGSTGGDLFFNFIFASEEYPDFVGQANDAFAIFLNGNNIALLPGTSTPVTINNVNAGSNSQYFVDNANNTYLSQYNGFTTSIQASVPGLSAGTHSIKFAIADAYDASFDSAVFIQAGSFGSTATPVSGAAVPEPGQVAASLLLLGGIGGYVFLKRRKSAKAATPLAA